MQQRGSFQQMNRLANSERPSGNGAPRGIPQELRVNLAEADLDTHGQNGVTVAGDLEIVLVKAVDHQVVSRSTFRSKKAPPSGSLAQPTDLAHCRGPQRGLTHTAPPGARVVLGDLGEPLPGHVGSDQW